MLPDAAILLRVYARHAIIFRLISAAAFRRR